MKNPNNKQTIVDKKNNIIFIENIPNISFPIDFFDMVNIKYNTLYNKQDLILKTCWYRSRLYLDMVNDKKKHIKDLNNQLKQTDNFIKQLLNHYSFTNMYKSKAIAQSIVAIGYEFKKPPLLNIIKSIPELIPDNLTLLTSEILNYKLINGKTKSARTYIDKEWVPFIKYIKDTPTLYKKWQNSPDINWFNDKPINAITWDYPDIIDFIITKQDKDKNADLLLKALRYGNLRGNHERYLKSLSIILDNQPTWTNIHDRNSVGVLQYNVEQILAKSINEKTKTDAKQFLEKWKAMSKHKLLTINLQTYNNIEKNLNGHKNINNTKKRKI